MDAFLRAVEHVGKAGGECKMMFSMQDDQPESCELAAANDDEIEEWFDYYATSGLPIP